MYWARRKKSNAPFYSAHSIFISSKYHNKHIGECKKGLPNFEVSSFHRDFALSILTKQNSMIGKVSISNIAHFEGKLWDEAGIKLAKSCETNKLWRA